MPILFIVGHAQGASPCTRPKPLHPATLEVGELRAVRLKEAGLLREVRVGNNKPNRLYLQNVDATLQIIEHYDENGQLLKQYDYFGNLLFEEKKLSTVPAAEEVVETLDNSGIPNSGIPGRPNFGTPDAQDLTPSNTYISKTNKSIIISSRKPNKNSDEFSQAPRAETPPSQKSSVKYVQPQYYSLLGVIADRYNGKFTQYDLFTGEFQNYSLTHKQKMLIGQYLSEGYVTSQEVIDLIENRIPLDCVSPLAYLLKSLENLKQERILEQKIHAHGEAESYYRKKSQQSKKSDGNTPDWVDKPYKNQPTEEEKAKLAALKEEMLKG